MPAVTGFLVFRAPQPLDVARVIIRMIVERQKIGRRMPLQKGHGFFQ
jgi:hypothetical protein